MFCRLRPVQCARVATALARLWPHHQAHHTSTSHPPPAMDACNAHLDDFEADQGSCFEVQCLHRAAEGSLAQQVHNLDDKRQVPTSCQSNQQVEACSKAACAQQIHNVRGSGGTDVGNLQRLNASPGPADTHPQARPNACWWLQAHHPGSSAVLPAHPPGTAPQSGRQCAAAAPAPAHTTGANKDTNLASAGGTGSQW